MTKEQSKERIYAERQNQYKIQKEKIFKHAMEEVKEETEQRKLDVKKEASETKKTIFFS